MAQHDYVIDNSTGANVRADINNALLAISSTNSGSSAPSTTYAFQLFANTTTSKLQIRNAANSAFVDLIGLDGSILLADGSVSSPSLAFSDDLNTGIFSSAADTFNVATGGVERMELGTTTIFNEGGADVDFRIEGDTEANLFYVDAGNNRIGIGTASPASTLDVNGDLTITAAAPALLFTETNGDPDFKIQCNGGAFSITDTTNSETRLRINASGNVGIGETSVPLGKLHVKTADSGATAEVSADELVVEGSNHSGISVLSGTGNAGTINFGDSGDNDIGRIIYNHSGNVMSFNTDASERMRITSSGGIRIGATDDPHGDVDDVLIATSGNTGITIRSGSSSAGNIVFADGTSGTSRFEGTISYLHSVNAMVFNTSDAERVRILSTGVVGIGTSTPSTSFRTTIQENTSGHGCLLLDRTTNIDSVFRSFISFKRSGTEVGTIKVNNSTTQYNTSSDYRLKENATAISDGITRLKTLKPYRFNFKVNPSTTVDGFFAHEVTAVPEAISGEKDAVKEDGSIDPQGIDQSKLVPLLVAAVQELIGKVEALEAA